MFVRSLACSFVCVCKVQTLFQNNFRERERKKQAPNYYGNQQILQKISSSNTRCVLYNIIIIFAILFYHYHYIVLTIIVCVRIQYACVRALYARHRITHRNTCFWCSHRRHRHSQPTGATVCVGACTSPICSWIPINFSFTKCRPEKRSFSTNEL